MGHIIRQKRNELPSGGGSKIKAKGKKRREKVQSSPRYLTTSQEEAFHGKGNCQGIKRVMNMKETETKTGRGS